MSEDPNKIAAIEKAITEKYGKETVQNPKGNWNDDKEKEYLEQSKQFYKKQYKKKEWQEIGKLKYLKIFHFSKYFSAQFQFGRKNNTFRKSF